MQFDDQSSPVSNKILWAGRIMSGLPALFLLFGGVMNLVRPAFVVKGTVRMGYSEQVIRPLGIVLLVCTALYLFPRTAVLGAILLTGYLGGAVATHVRNGDGPFEIYLLPRRVRRFALGRAGLARPAVAIAGSLAE